MGSYVKSMSADGGHLGRGPHKDHWSSLTYIPFLAHLTQLTQRVRWAIVTTERPSSVCSLFTF
jgi:hypothetical protein